MGLFGRVFGKIVSEVLLPSEVDLESESPKRYTPEEFIVREQELTGEEWHGVRLSELSRIAQDTYRGRFVKVDEYGLLVFHYSSNSRKTKLSVQCELDECAQLVCCVRTYYPGQWWDSADQFVELANQNFTFDRYK